MPLKLTTEDDSTGLDESQVRQIVLEEQLSLVEILRHEVVSTPMRADGNMNVRDFDQTLDIVQSRIRNRITV